MSANHNDSKLDIELDRHIGALRDEAAAAPDAGPTAEIVAKTQAMIRDVLAEAKDDSKHVTSDRRPLYQRLVAMTFAQRIAAVVMITLGALTLYIVFMLFNSLAPSVAFSQVATQLAKAHTFSFFMTAQSPGTPPVKVRMLFKDPQQVRTEMPGGMTTIINDRKTMILSQTQHTATIMSIEGERIKQPGQPETVVDAIRSMGQARGEKIGEQTIDGIVCTGFKALHQGRPMTVWADKKTAQPVRIEMTMPMGEKQITMVMDQFQLDPPLDDSLFSLEVPAGYTPTQRTITIPKLSEFDREVAKLLKEYADASDDHTFPSSMTDWSALIKKYVQVKPIDSKALNDAVTRVGVVSGMLYSLPDGYDYAGKGVKLGEKDKIIFWHRPATGEATVKAIFGDLRIEEVPVAKLPATTTTTTTQP